MNMFEPGKTYSTRSLCDHECIYRVRIIKRTAATITADLEGCGGRGLKTFRVHRDHEGDECFRPLGSYSMAPVIRAS